MHAKMFGLFLASMLLIYPVFLNLPHALLFGGECQSLLYSTPDTALPPLSLNGTGDKVGSDAEFWGKKKVHWWHLASLNQMLLNKMPFVWIVMHRSNYLCVWAPSPHPFVPHQQSPPPPPLFCLPLPRSSPANPALQLDHRLASP